MTNRGTDTERDVQLSRLAALGEPIRRMLYRFVAAQPEAVSRDQAAAGVGVARHVAKFHLDRLADDGLLDTDYQRPPGRTGPGAGRPTKLYRPTRGELAVSLPERHYDLAANILAQAVTAAQQAELPLADALRTTARQTGAQLGEAASSSDPPDATDAICDVLTAHGYEPVVEETDTDGPRITLRNCPFHQLAQAHTDLVCGLNLDLLTGLIDSHPGSGLQPRLDPGPNRCCVVLSPPDQT